MAYALILAFLLLAVRLAQRGKPTSSDADGCMAVAGMLTLGGYLTFRAYPMHVILLWLLNLLVLVFTNRWKLFRAMKGAYEGYKRRFT